MTLCAKDLPRRACQIKLNAFRQSGEKTMNCQIFGGNMNQVRSHSRRAQSLSFAICLLASIACASAQAAPRAPFVAIPPDAPSPEGALISYREPKEIDYGAATRFEGTNTVITGGRGSLAVGLMFGVLGVAANVAKIRAQRLERAKPLSAITGTNVVEALTTVRQSKTQSVAGTRSYELLPVSIISFEDDTTFHMACLISATLPGNGKRTWRARYRVQMFESYSSQSQDDVEAARQSISVCLTEANRLFEVHARGGMLPAPQPRQIEINGNTVPVFMVDSEPERAITVDTFGLVEYHPPITVPPIPEAPPIVPLEGVQMSNPNIPATAN